MNKKIRSLGLILVILLTPALMPAWSSESAAGTLDGGTGATERIALDSVPIPLPHDCDGVTPPGESPPACCAYGYVYYDGVPVAGANVHIESEYGELDTTTASGGASGEPYYAADLSAAPLLVSPGDIITVTASHEASSASAAYEAAPDGQQVDVAIVINRTLLFGDGSDGDLTIGSGQTYSIDSARTALSATANAGQNTLSVASSSGFAPGNEVFAIQIQGTGAGWYEFGIIESVGSGSLTLSGNLANTYTAGGNSKAQVLRVPYYRNVTVQDGGTLTAHAWDGNTGGIVVFRSSQQLLVQSGAIIDLAGKGFRSPGVQTTAREEQIARIGEQGEGTDGPVGTRSTSANGNGGGGGGYDTNDVWAGGRGGAGGGNGTAGTGGAGSGGGNAEGGNSVGGSACGNGQLTILCLGGGGGQGGINDTMNNASSYSSGGGTGSGSVILSARSVIVEGNVAANGNQGVDNNQPSGYYFSAAGGGGAGGSILITGESAALGTNKVTAMEGRGGYAAYPPTAGDRDGGTGGVGRIRIEYGTLSGSTNPSASTQQREFHTGPIVTIHTIYPHPATQGQDIVTCRGSAVDNDEDGASITQYVWRSDLDGILSTQAEFTKPASELSVGTHTIYFKARDDEGEWSEEISSVLAINEAVAPPAADFTADVLSGTVPLTVTFTSQSTGNITFYQWDFGDGATSPQQNPVHVYESSGTFAVSLTVTGPGGSDTETKAGYITATSETPESPLAEFTADVTSGTAPLTVQFTNQSTGDISSYSWDFGDGGASTQQNPAHTYDSAGAFTVSLTVTGPGGSDTDTKTDYITATSETPESPLAEFTADVTSGTAPLTVQFTNQSTGDISSYSWDFGDGGASTQQNPAHAYDSAGAFTVSLTATGPGGSDTETKVDYITALSDVEASWTFLLYLAGDNNLHRFLDDALHRLEENINPNVNVLVLIDGAGNNNTWRYDVQPGGDYTDNVNRWYMGELGMDDPQTLTNFVDWARQNYSATHTYLAIADHGLGTGGTAWDDTSGTHAHITVAELRTALQEATLDGADPLDVVHYDSCLMAMIENAYQIKEYASYLVASENLGWGIFAYDEYLDGVTESTTPRDLAVAVADKYHNHGWLSGYPRTISALDLSRAGTVKDAVSSLAAALQGSLEENKYYISNTRDATQKFDSQDYYRITLEDEYLDLYHFAQLIKQNVPDDTVKDAAQGVMDAIGAVGEGFVVAEHHESGSRYGAYWDLDNAHGVAIYYPPASGGYHYSDYLGHVFRFTADSEWDEFLLAYFGVMGLPPLPGEDPGVPPVLEPGRKVYLPAVSRN